MTDQTKNIETLQTSVNEITAALVEAKKLEDDALQKSKAETELLKTETLLTQVKTAKEEASTKLKTLEGKTDATSVAEISKLEEAIKKYEAMLIALDSSKTELTTLKAGVVAPITDDATEKKDETDNTKPEEKKDDQDKSWLKKQRDGVTSREEWKTNTGANVARMLGGIGIISVGVRGIKKLFGRGKKKEEKKEGETTEKKGFRQTGFGKAIKVIGFGGGTYYLIHGLVSGRWGLSDFFNRDKKEKINPDDLNSRYDKEVPEALKPKYEAFGGKVDEYRKATGYTDSLGTLEDDENKEVAIPKGAVPAAMDKAYDNVGDMLDTNGDIKEVWARIGGKIWGLVNELGGKVVGNLFKLGVGCVKGLKSTMFGSDGEPNDEFKKWAETEDLTRDEQVANLMQKYSMVRFYLNDKRKQLTRKYTIDQLKLEGIPSPTEEQIEEYELNKDMVDLRVETDFLSKKIVGLTGAESAVTTLETQNIYDASVSVETQAILDEVKTTRKEIIPDETIRERAKSSVDINKDDALRTELSNVSTKFGTHLKEGILQRNIIEGIANGFGILNLDELRNSEADDLEEAIEKLGFGDDVKKFQLQNIEFYTKLQNKTLTKADIEKFETTINEYFSLLQKVMLETQAQQENEAGNFGERLGTRFLGRMRFLVSTPMGWGIMVGGYVLSKRKWGRKILAEGAVLAFDTLTKPVKFFTRNITRRVNVPTTLGNKYMKNLSYGSGTAGYNKFKTDFEKGRISYDDAEHVFRKHQKYADRNNGTSKYFREFLGTNGEMGLNPEQISTLKKYFNNKNVRNILGDGTTTLADLTTKLDVYDKKLATLSGNKKTFCQELFAKSKFTKIDDIDLIVRNIDNIDVSGLSSDQIKKLAKELGGDVSILSDVTKVTAKINEIKKVVKPTIDVIDNLKLSTITNMIDNELVTIKATWTSMTPGSPDYSIVRKNYYEQSIEGLEQFKKQANLMTEVDFNTIRKMTTYGFKLDSVAKLHRMVKLDTSGLIADAIKKGDPSELKYVLTEIATKDAEFAKYVVKSDIDDVVSNIDVLIKKAATANDFVEPLLKNMDNIFRLFTKIT